MSRISADLLEDVARRMARCRTSSRICAMMRDELPEIYRQLSELRSNSPLLRFWGASLNFDENARRQIVHPRILAAIAEISAASSDGQAFHAGVLHTYGYLLSVIDTPYGKKRERWLLGKMAKGLGLKKSLLGPAPAEGSLLANLTYLLAKVSARNDETAERRLQSLAPLVAKSIIQFDYRALKIFRIHEYVSSTEMSSKEVAGKARSVTIRTDLVPFPASASRGAEFLLIYSSAIGRAHFRLHTGFEISKSYAEALLRGDDWNGQVVPRYNSAIKNFTANLPGRRRCLEL